MANEEHVALLKQGVEGLEQLAGGEPDQGLHATARLQLPRSPRRACRATKPAHDIRRALQTLSRAGAPVDLLEALEAWSDDQMRQAA
jgi:hypothetical protein